MANVELDGIEILRLLKWESNKESSVSTQEWINNTNASTNVDENVWCNSENTIILTLRANDESKNSHETSANTCATVILDDNGTTYTVWIRKIVSRWDGATNDTYPWLMTIELVEDDS